MTDMILEGKFRQLKGKVKERWGKLTDDDVDAIEGKAEQLYGKLQEKYGYTKQRAEQEVSDFMRSLEGDSSSS